jgi:(p)ppGpp synthase/HD superfamily hydrolase
MDHYVPELDVNASEYDLAVLAVYFHDAIEDARMTYNDVRKLIGERAADAVYAVTNEKGKNRAERANDKYYQGIRETPLATFVKLCDRIANVKYGLMVGSHMAEMYGKENPDFVKKLGYNEEHPLAEMFEHLNSLLK